MSIEAALIAAMKADAGIAALVADAVFVAGGRQGSAYPYVTIQRVATAGAARLDGVATLEWPMFQIDAWATKAIEALAVGEAIRAAIEAVEVPGSPAFTATFQDQRGPAPDEETRNFRVSQDYLLWHER